MQDLFFGSQDFTSDTLLRAILPMLDFQSYPEGVFSYGNYILAGLILEQVSGLSYKDYVNQYVIAPAGLQHTGYCLPHPADMAQGYYKPSNQLEPIDTNISAVYAAGSVCSTAGDLLQWIDALSSGALLSTYMYLRMITPYPNAEDPQECLVMVFWYIQVHTGIRQSFKVWKPAMNPTW
jgi:CubicO group peptidase (beta-lactamase class C family)